MKTSILLPSLLIGGGSIAGGVIISQVSSSNTQESPSTQLTRIQTISTLIPQVKTSFQSLQTQVTEYEKEFEILEKMKKEGTTSEWGTPKMKSLISLLFLHADLESLLKEDELSASEKASLEKEKETLSKEIEEMKKEMEKVHKEWLPSQEKHWDLEKVSTEANTISSKMESIYEELFHLFKLNTHLSSKSHKSKWLSTIEKIGLMETKNSDSYITKNPKFTKTFGDASEEIITKIQENEYFTIKDQTLSFKFMEKDNDKSMWNLLFSAESDNNNLSKWKKWVGFR